MRPLQFISKSILMVLILAGWVTEQIARTTPALQVLCEFPGSSNSAPRLPNTALIEIQPGDFFGTTQRGGTNDNGTVYRVTATGALTPVFMFNGFNGSSPSDLAVGKNGDLFGLSRLGGGPGSYGTMFEVSTSGVFRAFQTNGNFTSFFLFSGTNGSSPGGKLILGADGNFYGMARNGGSSSGNGTIFKITTNAVLTVLWTFNGTNGSQPSAGLTLGKSGAFFGTTAYGGSNYTGVNTGNGTVFQITTNGLLTTLAFFNGANGSTPLSGLAQASDGNFYGTTLFGGTHNLGTVFQITTNGSLTTLTSFDGTNGSNPSGGLTQGSDGSLYGTTAFSVANGTNFGTIFNITTNGTLTTLVCLNGTNGRNAFSDMRLGRDGNLYGAMGDINARPLLDGSYGNIFRIVQQPVVSVGLTNNQAIVSWTSFTNGVYRVDRKSSLADTSWIPLATNTATSDVTSFTNSSLNTAQYFYRVVLF